jgi:membrane glycosyltransferase
VLILDADMAPEPYCLSVLHEALMRAGPHTAFIQSAHRFYDLPAGDVFYSRSLLFNTKTLSYFGSYG